MVARPRVDKATYAPRGMRLDRAAAYLDMSRSTFVRLVDEKALPAGVHIRGIVVWDRYDLDAAFEDFKSNKHRPRNSADEALGINTDDAND